MLARTEVIGLDVDAHLVCTHVTNRRVQTLVYVHAYVSPSLWVCTARPARLEIAQLVATVITPTVPVIALLSIIVCAVAAQEALV
jgi:hypothetical protein